MWRDLFLRENGIPSFEKLVIEDNKKIPIEGNPYYFDEKGYLKRVSTQEISNRAFGKLMSKRYFLRNNATLEYYSIDKQE